jgi:hypothetical protein
VSSCAGPSLIARASSSPATKNVLLIVTDDQRADTFWAMPKLKTWLQVPGWHDQRIFDRPEGTDGAEEGNYVNYGLLENGEHRMYGTGAASYSTNRLFQLAREFIVSVPPERPFLAVVAPNAPHHPYTPQGSDKFTHRE